VHLVGFIIRIYHDARSFECQIPEYYTKPDHSISLNIEIVTVICL